MKNLAVFGIMAVVAVALIIIALGFNGFFNLQDAKQAPVQIGVIMPLTGDAALYGESMGTALELAREEINSNGGIIGKQVEFVIEDSACDTKAGVNAVNSLINLKGMKIIIAADCSGPTLAAAPIAEKAKVFYLVAIATNPDIKYAGDYIFRIAPSDSFQGKDLAQAVYKKGLANATILFVESSYGQGIEKIFKEEFGKLGGKISLSQGFSQTDSDFRAQLTKIKDSKFDSIIIIGYPQSYGLILKQMNELGIKGQIFASDTFKDSALIQDLGPLAEGIIFTGFAEKNSSEFLEFKEAYKKRFGKDLGPYAEYGYDSLYVLKTGIELAKSFDPEILKQKFYGVEFNGATGLTEFDSFGEVTSKHFDILTIKNGEFVTYKE
ncbi:MAG: ABC transporter substrate-binding protein [Candidatus ainarchaeum sp.]|nr:ABC transporter substrate-binding protein [Candidatus ainarchaeum sp.]